MGNDFQGADIMAVSIPISNKQSGMEGFCEGVSIGGGDLKVSVRMLALRRVGRGEGVEGWLQTITIQPKK